LSSELQQADTEFGCELCDRVIDRILARLRE
jgi:hypothetical protein